MPRKNIEELVASYWIEAERELASLGEGDHLLLNTANSAVDTVWDRQIFARSETFGGTEIGFATVLSALILARLLEVDYVALASVTATTIPPCGSPVLDAGLSKACQDALNTFSGDLLGPVAVEDRLIYAQPILLESPIPVGVVLLATREPLAPRKERLLLGYLSHLDTRMNLAEKVLKLRKEIDELQFENRRLKGESLIPTPVALGKPKRAPADFGRVVEELARSVPVLNLFGIELPFVHFDEFCGHFDALTGRYLTILEEAPNLYLDIMNDQAEEEEVDALYARSHPYEFRTANIGEVFALLALYRTVMDTMPESLQELKAKILSALPKYQAAKSFLLAYDRFEDIPLRGAQRFQPPDSEKLLLNRENAPAFGTLLWAFRQEDSA